MTAPSSELLPENFETESVLLAQTADQGYEDLGFADISGTAALDFDLVNPNSPAVNAGTDISEGGLDYLNRVRIVVGGTDIGAFEHGATQIECIPR